MLDPRITKLAKALVGYSCDLKKGEKILIEVFDIPEEMVIALIREATRVGGVPLVTIKSNKIIRILYRNATEEQMKLIGDYEGFRMEKMDAYIGLRGNSNISELGDVPQEKMKLYQTHWWHPVHIEKRVKNTKWVVLRWPTSSMAQLAQMSTETFEDFYFNVCTLDYSRMSRAMDPLKELMERTDKVHITGPGTDLQFSIKDIAVIKCDGKLNIPDGEVFTAPVKDSVNGYVQYNTPTLYHGTVFENIRLEFRNGKIIKATGSDEEKINSILNSDKGARYVGEFALGVNPYITKAMKDILFDEKIMGSFHFTPGNSYDDASNGNISEVHWDMVCIQTPEYGGGEIYFDGKLIRKDGIFIPKDLQGLNPDKLL
ncbi:MAG: aminopeptidase [Candidatus Thermoplasmatota archaeon]|jgi:aminopeptidase|nr:aminopeptidase [Candidatus Thermoplasmatota archaeon]